MLAVLGIKGESAMFWAWAAVLQVLVVGLMGAAVSLLVLRHDDDVNTKIRRFPSRWRRWVRRRGAVTNSGRQVSSSSRDESGHPMRRSGRGPQSTV